MGYFLRRRDYGNGRPLDELWEVTDTLAVRRDMADPRSVPCCYFEAAPGENAWTTMARLDPTWSLLGGRDGFHEATLLPGQYHPRMARPLSHMRSPNTGWNPRTLDSDINFLAGAVDQLKTLTRHLSRICQTVHPSIETFETYGHEIRNLLILACMEAETHWRGILECNGVRPRQNASGEYLGFSTNDYVKLQNSMRLGDYSVSFHTYPWIPTIRPFENWSATKPTGSLRWYDAYNKVKHNRENEFREATLAHSFEAISACLVMIIAQFGEGWGFGYGLEISSFFKISQHPRWNLSEHYIPPSEPILVWSPINYIF